MSFVADLLSIIKSIAWMNRPFFDVSDAIVDNQKSMEVNLIDLEKDVSESATLFNKEIPFVVCLFHHCGGHVFS